MAPPNYSNPSLEVAVCWLFLMFGHAGDNSYSGIIIRARDVEFLCDFLCAQVRFQQSDTAKVIISEASSLMAGKKVREI